MGPCRRSFRESFGAHRPICGGACLLAHTGWENLTPVSLFLIIVPACCWFYFLAAEVSDRVTPALPVLLAFNAATTLGLLFTTMLTEPGILRTITYEEYGDENPDVPVRVVSHVLLDGREYELAQFRAKFSRFTENCIENFDHYCPWVGNAVGKRNYRYFVLFLTSSLTLAALVAASCTAYLIERTEEEGFSFVTAMEKSVAATVLAVYGFCMLFSLLGLCGFHLKAIASNMTTNEILKGAYASSGVNPHDQGCTRNCWTFLCAPIPRSRVAMSQPDSPLLRDDAHPIEPSSDPRHSSLSRHFDDTTQDALEAV